MQSETIRFNSIRAYVGRRLRRTLSSTCKLAQNHFREKQIRNSCARGKFLSRPGGGSGGAGNNEAKRNRKHFENVAVNSES